MKTRGTLAQLRRRLPAFSSETRELPLSGGRGAVMRLLASAGARSDDRMGAGLRFDTPKGSVTVAPVRERSALRIKTESYSTEAAKELGIAFEDIARDCDDRAAGQK